MNRYYLIVSILMSVVMSPGLALSSGANFNDTTNKVVFANASSNVGIGTTAPQVSLVVSVGNVGIGTWTASANILSVYGRVGIGSTASSAFVTTAAPAGGMIIEGNVGIGSKAPGGVLDVGAGRIVNSATPTLSTDGATKSYVDGKFGASYQGLTASTYDGNRTGITGMNSLCDSNYTGSHVCTQSEMTTTGATTFTATGWVVCEGYLYLQNAIGYICLGQTSQFSVSAFSGTASCGDWTSNSSSDSGPTVSSTGVFSSSTCDTANKIHCCK